MPFAIKPAIPLVTSQLSPAAAYRLGGIQICAGIDRRAARAATCLVDGDTGWESGVKWRLSGVDTPELTTPGCPAEYELALRAQHRLRALLGTGYRVEWTGRTEIYGRALVHIALRDGRDASDVLLAEGLAQPWPNWGNVWCEGSGGPPMLARWAAEVRNWLRTAWRKY